MKDIPEIWVFNFQEIVPLNAQSMMISSSNPQFWDKYLLNEVNAFIEA